MSFRTMLWTFVIALGAIWVSNNTPLGDFVG